MVNNYLASFLLCCAFTVLAALGDNPNVRWLLISDVNVAIWLAVAWLLDWRR